MRLASYHWIGIFRLTQALFITLRISIYKMDLIFTIFFFSSPPFEYYDSTLLTRLFLVYANILFTNKLPILHFIVTFTCWSLSLELGFLEIRLVLMRTHFIKCVLFITIRFVGLQKIGSIETRIRNRWCVVAKIE